METPRQKATAFHIGLGDAGGAKKPKPKSKGPFKFLRKDEGARADAQNVSGDQPLPGGAGVGRGSSAHKARESLRRQMVEDIRRGAVDHFDAEVAVPKKPPPPPKQRGLADQDKENQQGATKGNTGHHSRHSRQPPAQRNTYEEPDVEDEDFVEEQEDNVPTQHHQPSGRSGSTGARRAAPGGRHVDPDTSVMDDEPAEDNTPASSSNSPGRTTVTAPSRAKTSTAGGQEIQSRLQAARQQQRVSRNELLRNRQQPPSTRATPREDEYDDDEEDQQYQDPYEVEEEVEYRRPQSARPSTGARRNFREDAPPTTGGNYFRRPQAQRHSVQPEADESENLLMDQLQQELEDCKRERARYRNLSAEVLREKQKAERARDEAEEQLQAERDEFEAYILEEKKALRKERRQLEDKARTQSSATEGDRDEIKRLKRENERLQRALADAQDDFREEQKLLKAEIDNLSISNKDLEAKNANLRESLRQQQMQRFESLQKEQEEAAAARAAREDKKDDEHREGAVSSRARQLKADNLEERMRKEEENRQLRLKQQQELREKEERQQRERREQQEQDRIERERARREEAAAEQEPNLPVRGNQRRGPRSAQDLLDDEPPPAEDFPNDVVTSRNEGTDGKVEKIFRSGKREITYVNGTKKVMLPDGHMVLYFSNGDIRRTFASQKTTYWYAANQTTHTQLPDGVQIFEFQLTNQTEKHYPDGRKEIFYPGGEYKVLRPDGTQEDDNDQQEEHEY